MRGGARPHSLVDAVGRLEHNGAGGPNEQEVRNSHPVDEDSPSWRTSASSRVADGQWPRNSRRLAAGAKLEGAARPEFESPSRACRRRGFALKVSLRLFPLVVRLSGEAVRTLELRVAEVRAVPHQVLVDPIFDVARE